MRPAVSSSACGKRLSPSFRHSVSVSSTSRSLPTWNRRRRGTKRGRNAATRVMLLRCANSCSRCALRQRQRPKPDSSTERIDLRAGRLQITGPSASGHFTVKSGDYIHNAVPARVTGNSDLTINCRLWVANSASVPEFLSFLSLTPQGRLPVNKIYVVT